MTPPRNAVAGRSQLFTPRNLVLLAVAFATVGAGYVVLSQGTAPGSTPDVAAVLLVIGYVILFPVALIL